MERHQFITACKEGAAAMEQAMKALQRDYWGPLLREATLVLRDRDRALDAVQDTLIKAWGRCPTFRGQSELFPWLKQILRNLAVDELARLKRFEPLDDSTDTQDAQLRDAAVHGPYTLPAQVEEALFDKQLEALYRRCAERFAEAHPGAANVIRWIAEDDLGVEEIAELLQRSRGATRQFMTECRKKARVYFAPYFEALATGAKP